MKSNPGRIVACSGDCALHSVATRHAHHCDFPELWAEGRDVAEAVNQLAQNLSRALEQSPAGWQREGIEQALTDLDAFRERLALATAGSLDPGDPHCTATAAVVPSLVGAGRPLGTDPIRLP